MLASVWLQHVEPGAPPYVHRTVPNGSIELSCRLGGEPRVVGPRSGPAVDVLAPGATLVGVRFRPGVPAAAIGATAAELVDRSAPAADLWGRPAASLGAALAEAADAPALLEAHVAVRLHAHAGAVPDPVVAAAVLRLLPWRSPDVGGLPDALAISDRQLRRRFQAALGFGPKALQRMLRFQGFLALVQQALAEGRPPAPAGLARLAADAGYADQAHLTRECARLMGIAPGAFLHEAEHHCAPAHDHRASFAPLLRPLATA